MESDPIDHPVLVDTTAEIDKIISKRLEEWIPHLEKRNEPESAERVRQLKKNIEGLETPF